MGANSVLRTCLWLLLLRALSVYAGSIEEDIADMHNSGMDLNKINEKGVNMLIAAARNGNVEVVQALTKLKTVKLDTQDTRGETALIAACKGQHPALALVLCTAGCDVNLVDAEKQTALLCAARLGYTALVEGLIARGAALKVVDFEGLNALLHGAGGGHRGVVQALIKAGINLDMRSRLMGATALGLAAQAGHLDIVSDLVMAGASVNKLDAQGVPPVFHLCRNAQPAAVQLLIDHNADVNIASKRLGETPLTGACISGSLPTVQALIKAGANVNHHEYESGFTPLMLAASRGHKDIVVALLEAGADVQATRSRDGKVTARDQALLNKHVALATLIENFHKSKEAPKEIE